MFVLLLIALVAVGGLAGGVSAMSSLKIDFGGPYGPDDQNQITYNVAGTGGYSDVTAGATFWIDSINIEENQGSNKLMLNDDTSPNSNSYELFSLIQSREGYHVDGLTTTPDGDTYVFNEDGVVQYTSDDEYVLKEETGQSGTTTQPTHHFYQLTGGGNNVETLYVKWVANTTTVKFDIGDGTTPTSKNIKTGDTSITGIGVPAREGYELNSYYWHYNNYELFLMYDGTIYASDYTDANYKFKTNSTRHWIALVDGAEITVTPKWNAITNEIIFNANGGTFPTSGVTELKDLYSTGAKGQTDEVTIYLEDPTNYEIPTFGNKIFKGWGLRFDGHAVVSGVNITPSSGWNSGYGQQHLEILPNANAEDEDGNQYIKNGKWVGIHTYDSTQNLCPVTLYAIWEDPLSNNGGAAILSSTSKYRDSHKAEYCQVFFEANGGNGVMEAQQFTVGEPRELNLNEFTYEDHPFDGWALEQFGAVVYTDGQEITVSGDTTLYAVWGIPEIPVTPVDPQEPSSPLGILGILGGLGAAVVLRRR